MAMQHSRSVLLSLYLWYMVSIVSAWVLLPLANPNPEMFSIFAILFG